MAIELRLYAAMQIVDHPETLPKAGDNDVGWFRFAICDLERLDGESGNATGRSRMSSGGAPWLELEGMITEGVREVECFRPLVRPTISQPSPRPEFVTPLFPGSPAPWGRPSAV
jgi:hypothetical protein